ncbi:MAG: hypothetical protein HC788_15600 [Sphingopyxis sp.]|nr:hypothetical protein [Sphingopyxis sp.]
MIAAIEIARRYARLIRERFPRTIRRNAGYGLDLVLDQIEAPRGTSPDDVDLAGEPQAVYGMDQLEHLRRRPGLVSLKVTHEVPRHLARRPAQGDE